MKSNIISPPEKHHINHTAFRQGLLEWYQKQKRILPWRSVAEDAHLKAQDKAYAVWLSEIMLQQTVVKAVRPYFEKFMTLWPDIHSLAAADEDILMQEWAGLGYYSRARNLLKCAKYVVQELGGELPDNEAALIKLPGIGPYTAAAITAIAFNKPATVIDGNVDRIIVRLYALDNPIRNIKPEIRALAFPFFMSDAVAHDGQHSHFAQSLMDLGAGICIAGTPRCMLCPVKMHCLAYETSCAEALPVKPIKKRKPHKYGDVFVVCDKAGRVVVEKRADKGLLASTFGFPTSEWSEEVKEFSLPRFLQSYAVRHENVLKEGVRHVFTHFSLSLRIKKIEVSDNISLPYNMMWVEKDVLFDVGMPTLFSKVMKYAFL